jgi:hypothetical protein
MPPETGKRGLGVNTRTPCPISNPAETGDANPREKIKNGKTIPNRRHG